MEPSLGPYQVLEQLGEGGAGAVFRGRDTRDGREVAIKLLLRPTAQRMGRFQLEAATLARLQHPNVIPVLDYGIAADGRPYLVLELIRGQTLQRRLDTGGPLTPQEAVEVAQQVAAALCAAHAQDLLHRDVKPENVLLRAVDGAAILSDFGLAKELGSQLQRLTQTGAIMGTPGFLAPEQLGSSQLHTPALDVYGVGATLYACLTGEAPITGASAMEVFQATLARAPTPPSQLVSLPSNLEALCLRCLAKDPQERFPDASALLDALEQLDSGSAPEAGWRKHPLLLLLPLLVVVGGLLGWEMSPVDEPSPSKAPARAVPTPAGTVVSPPASPPLSTPGESKPTLVQSELADLIARSDLALAKHDPGAAELVREAYRLAPELPRARLNMALMLVRERKPSAALAHLDRALELEPDLSPAYALRAQIYLLRGDPKAAQRDVDEALSRDENSNTAWAVLGKIRAQRSDLRGAMRALSRAIEIYPGPLHYADRAALNVALGRHARARADLDQALRLAPHLARPWIVSGQLKRLVSDPTSLEDFERALSIDPDDADALAGRAERLMAAFRYEEAISDTTRVLSLVPDRASPLAQDALLDRSVSHLYRGDYDAALKDVRELDREAPDHPLGSFWRSEIHYRLGDFPAAVKQGLRALERRKRAIADKRTPRNMIAGLSRSLAKLARAQRLAGQEQASLETLRRSIDVAHPRDPYPRLWAVAFTGDRDFVKKWTDPDPWPRPIGDYFLGRLDRAKLLAKATARSPRAICQVQTLFGVEAEREGEQSRARSHYRAAVETGLGQLDEFAWSELRLSGR
jgi:serine/threonine protein kinase/Tfp pilus assembly protein PilF